MSSVCLFASHFEGERIPPYVKVYLGELSRFFERVYFLNTTTLAGDEQVWLRDKGMIHLEKKSEGFDFGLWYKALREIDLTGCDLLALVNDSCVLFRPLDGFWTWSQQNSAQVQGITFSEAVTPHIQSYFMLLKGDAVFAASEFIRKQGIKTTHQEVISDLEIGLSVYLRSKNFRMDAMIDNGGYRGEFSPYYQCIGHHIRQDIPLIKRRVLQGDYRGAELFTLARMGFRLDPKYYARLIRQRDPRLLFDLDAFIKTNFDLPVRVRIRYLLLRGLILVARAFSPLRKAGNKHQA